MANTCDYYSSIMKFRKILFLKLVVTYLLNVNLNGAIIVLVKCLEGPCKCIKPQ